MLCPRALGRLHSSSNWELVPCDPVTPFPTSAPGDHRSPDAFSDFDILRFHVGGQAGALTATLVTSESPTPYTERHTLSSGIWTHGLAPLPPPPQNAHPVAAEAPCPATSSPLRPGHGAWDSSPRTSVLSPWGQRQLQEVPEHFP